MASSVFMCAVLNLLVLFMAAKAHIGERKGEPTNSFAVEVPWGDKVAEAVARRHGFINHGKVSRRRVLLLN